MREGGEKKFKFNFEFKFGIIVDLVADGGKRSCSRVRKDGLSGCSQWCLRAGIRQIVYLACVLDAEARFALRGRVKSTLVHSGLGPARSLPAQRG